MRPGLKVSAVVVCVLAMVGVSACSSSSKSSSSAPSTNSPAATSSAGSSPAGSSPAASSSATPIVLGYIGTLSGIPAFQSAGELDAFTAWAKTVNGTGGIDGHPVKIVSEDDQSSPGQAVIAAQALVSHDVAAIMDGSGLDQIWAPTVEAAHIPVVGFILDTPPFATSPDFYPEGQSQDSIYYATVATAKSAGAPNIGDIHCVESPLCSQGAHLVADAAKQEGLPDVYSAGISSTAPNYTAQCVAAQQQHVSSIFIGESAALAEKLATDCAQQGYEPIWVTQGPGFGPGFLTTAGLKANTQTEYPDLPFWANTPAVQAFNAAMDKYYPGMRKNSTVFTEDVLMAWVSAKLLQDAITAGGLTTSGTVDAAEVTNGLLSLKGDTVDGLAPAPLTFAANQAHHVDCWFPGAIQNGVPRLLNDGKAICHGS
jgi:branched-chain amino acid transport system substrate-binding protein